MDVSELARVLERSGVDPDRYRIEALVSKPEHWMLRGEGSVWLRADRDGSWTVSGGGIGPHYTCTGVLARFATEDEACRAFAAELTRDDGREAFAAHKAAWSADCVRRWWEGEVRIALEEPEVAQQRARWREVWRERAAASEPVMTLPELAAALVAAGVARERVWIEGLDGSPVREAAGSVIRRDERGRWSYGRWRDDEAPGLFEIEYRFATEGELCRHFYDDSAGPYELSPPLTREQWREQVAVLLDNRAARQEADREFLRRIDEEEPADVWRLNLRLHRVGVGADRFGITGVGPGDPFRPGLDPDAVVLRHDPAVDSWWAEGGQEVLPDGRPAVLRRFASSREAFAVFERELTRADGRPFAAEKAAVRAAATRGDAGA